MPEVPVTVTPAVMRSLREAAGVDLEDAAARVHKDPATVDAWETGREDPPISSLEQLAGLYRKPLAAFLLADFQDEPGRPVDYRTAWGQGAGALGPKVVQAIARARQAQHAADEVLRSLSLDVTLPDVAIEDVEGTAARIRDALGVTIEAQMSWIDAAHAVEEWRGAVESLNIIVLELSMPTSQVRAFSIASDPPVIVLNKLDSSHGQIFSLFHEFGHVLRGLSGLCIPQSGLRGLPRVTAPAAIERWCNDLAGAVLIPREPLERIPRVQTLKALSEPPSDGVLTGISSRFRTSRFVLWYRLRALGLIQEELFRAKWAQWPHRGPDLPSESAGGGGSGITRAERSVSENGRGFASLVLDAVAEGRISASSALDYLDVQLGDLGQVARQINLPAG